jgi:asparagine synthase (glutamine-hydrolysing)
VAKILTTWPTDGVLTSYENVFRLPSGNLLVAKDGNVHVRRYWTPGLDRTLKLGSESEYVDAFLELYSEAVRCRMRGSTTVGVTLSGGLDSGSVCALAARELRLRDASLHAFTSAPMFECGLNSTKFADESPFVEANRELMGNLLLQYVRAEGISPLAGIDRALDLLDDPIHGASNAYWIVGILQAAQVAGVDMLLTGAMGNTTVSWKGDRYGTLRGKARKYLLLSWAKPIRDGLRRLARRDPEAWLAGSPLNPGFATSLDIYRRKKEEGYDPNSVVSRNVCQARLDGIKVSLRVLGAHFSEFGAGYGMESADPTSDKRIIEFCLAIPSEIFRSDDMDRRLVRLAMKGLLPDQVRLNRRRGLQAADLRLRLLATMPEILDALDQLERHPLSREVLDLAKMKRVADQLGHRSDPEMTTHAGAVLMRGLMAGRLLTRF